jgi:hypothetical protein
MSESNINNQLIEKEYFHLQSQVDQFDNKSLTIKAWSVTLAVTVAGSSALHHNDIVLLFAALASFMFWLIDGSWKAFQYANYKRIREIEKYMRGETSMVQPLQIAKNWGESFREGGTKRFIEILFWRHVLLPHAILFFLLITIYTYQWLM